MRRISIICCILLFTISCGFEKNPIPYAAVNLNLDLTFKDKVLQPIGSYKEYTSKNINIALERAGYGGVLVVHNFLDEYKAFDRTCPYEVNPGITVEVDNEVRYAICPKCGTKYEIGMSAGVPDGSSRHGLLQYNVTKNGNTITVRN